MFNDHPHLSTPALHILESPDGPANFAQVYGDYYVAGFELGADAGACLAASARNWSSVESVTLSATVKLLFFSTTTSTTETDVQQTASADLNFCGYDTLRDQNVDVKVASSHACSSIQEAAEKFQARAAVLHEDVISALAGLPVDLSKPLSGTDYELLIGSGLIVQLLLMPYQSLPQYVSVLSSKGT